MCERFTQYHAWAEAHAFVSINRPPRNLRPLHDVAPTIGADVERLEASRPVSENALRPWMVSTRVDRTGIGDDDPTGVEPAEGRA